ncbi:MAG: alpha/beta hydrolase-fold protein [Gemmataceae bacterium]
MNGTWSRLDIGGKPAEVYDPPGESRPRFGVLYLHGAGKETLRYRPAFTTLFDELHLGCICPKGQRSWWTDRLCPEFDPQVTAQRYVLDQVVPFFRARWGLAPRGIGLLGIGMGGQGALRLAFQYAELFPVVAAIAPAIDYHELHGQGTPLDQMYDSKEQCRQDTATLHVPPHNYPPHIFFCIDPEDTAWYRGNDRLHEKLTALGIPHEYDGATSAGGHSWSYITHMAERAVRFLHQGLVTESRRLL